MGCGASSNQKEKYQFVKEETEKKKKKDEAEAAEKVAKAEEERRQAKRHDGADAQRKLSVSNITRVGQRLVDHYQVEKQGLAFASSQTAGRKPRAVSRIVMKRTGEVRACRTIRRRRVDAYSNSQELEMLLKLDHPNIIKIFEVFQDEVNTYQILQWCEGNKLLTRIRREGSLTEGLVAYLVQQMLSAVSHMHSSLVIHRNLDLAHFCLYEEGPLEKCLLKLCDFELATFLDKEGARLKEFVAPYDANVDVWSVGVGTYLLLSGTLPFRGDNVDKVRGQIAEFKQTRANPEKSALDLQNLTDTASEFVLTLLNPDGEARCSAQDALHLPWLKSAHKVKKPLTSKAVQGILSYGHKTLLEKKCMQIIATTLPDDDIKDLVNMFQTLDKNGDGEVSLSELKDAVDAASKRGKAKGSKRKDEVTDSDILKLMESIDSNGNQRISYAEFLAACLEERHYTQEAAFWHAFRHFDRNNDGCISKQELNEALREGDELGDLVSRQLIDDMMKQAYLEIFQRLDNGLPAEDDGAKCSLQQAYSSLIAKGAVLVWRPFDVDQLIAAIWPNHAVPSQDGRISLSLTDRCLRLADPWCGIGKISGLTPCGRPRKLSSWATDLVLEMSHAAGTEVSIAGERFVVRQTLKDKQTSAKSTEQALRFLFVLHLCQVGEAFSCALIQFPRGCSPKDPVWATVAVRDSVPWRSLARHPDVYQKQTHLVGVKLTTAELKLLKLEGRVVVEGITDGKVQKGWRLCPGGDLPKVEKKSEFAAQLLGIREDPGLGEPDSFAAALSSLVTKSSEAPDTAVTLFFEKVTKGELAAMVPQHRALMVDLSFQARGEAEFLKDVIEVPRQPHVQGEAMLIGVSLARLAVAKEVPLQPSEATMALHQATKALQSSEILEQLSSTPDEWLWTKSRSFYRVLCNEAVGDVVDAWRALSSEERVANDSEYFTDQFLSLSCYGELIDSVNAKCMSIEGPLLARQVLVSFGSKEPSLRLWEALPVLSKPGRLAAQLWAMLRLDESLKSFGEARHALADGFFRCYSQEANGKKGTAELRLRLHFLLVLLELIWLRRQAFGDAADHDLCPGFPTEVGFREVLRQEVLLAATCWKRQRSEKDTAGKPHASSP